jgi:hypothetical protein
LCTGGHPYYDIHGSGGFRASSLIVLLDIGTTGGGIRPMLKRHKIWQLEEHYREETIAKGKAWFVRRRVGFSVVLSAMIVTVLYFVHGRTDSSLFAGLAVFPIGLLGGHLQAIWEWQDITKQRS